MTGSQVLTPKDQTPLLQAEGVEKTYKEAESGAAHVLKGVSLSLFPGEACALVGASGSGKSTLLYCLGLLDSIDKGQICFLGQQVHSLNANQRAEFRLKNLGFVFQFHHLIPELTALENVCLPCDIAGRTDLKASAPELLKRVGLSGKESRFPWQLSGGEQQRVAVARALANRPRLLLTDEATGNLDASRAAEVLDLILELASDTGSAVLSVTHDLQGARRYKKQYRLQDGRIWDLS